MGAGGIGVAVALLLAIFLALIAASRLTQIDCLLWRHTMFSVIHKNIYSVGCLGGPGCLNQKHHSPLIMNIVTYRIVHTDSVSKCILRRVLSASDSDALITRKASFSTHQHA